MAKHDFKTAESNYFSSVLSEQIWVSHWHISVGVNLAVMGTHDKDFGPAYCLNTMRIWIPIQILASNFDTLRMFKHSGFQKAQLFKCRMFIQKYCCKKNRGLTPNRGSLEEDSKPKKNETPTQAVALVRRIPVDWPLGLVFIYVFFKKTELDVCKIPGKTQNTILKTIG